MSEFLTKDDVNIPKGDAEGSSLEVCLRSLDSLKAGLGALGYQIEVAEAAIRQLAKEANKAQMELETEDKGPVFQTFGSTQTSRPDRG